MKSYIPSPLEVKAAIDGTLTNLIIPVKYYTEKDAWGVVYQTSQKPAPYAPDSIIYFREDIAEDGWDGCHVTYYVADNMGVECGFKSKMWDRIGDKPCRIAAQQMPREAARIYAKAGNPIAKRVQDITEGEAKGAGFPKTKHDDIGWHSHLRGLESAMPERFERNEWVWIYPVTVESTIGLKKTNNGSNI